MSPDRPLGRLLPLYLVIFIGFVGYALMITVFTPMLLHNSNGMLAVESTSADRAIALGFLLGLYPLGQFLGSPVLGALSDRYGRRPVLLLSLTASMLCYAAIVWSLLNQSLPLLLAASFVAGIGEANIVSAQGAIADIAPREQRGRYFGYIYLSVSLAYIVGPLAGGKLADPSLLPWFNDAVPFAAVLVLLGLAVLLVALRFRETHALSGSPEPLRPLAVFGGLSLIFTDQRLRAYFAANFLLYLAIFGFFRAYPMYLVEAFQLNASQVSEFIAWVGLPIVLVNLGLTGFLSSRLDTRTMTILSGALTGLLVLAIVLPSGQLWLWPLLFLAAAALALCLPACATLLSQTAGDAEQGHVMGCNQALQVGAEALSGIAAGLLAAIAVFLPLLALGGIALLGALFVATKIPKRTGAEQQNGSATLPLS